MVVHQKGKKRTFDEQVLILMALTGTKLDTKKRGVTVDLFPISFDGELPLPNTI
jgi:hypothetical protein